MITFNHTIVGAGDKHRSARFLADMLGLGEPTEYGPFAVVQVGDVSLDFADDQSVQPRHFAFLVGDDEFDAVHQRILDRELTYWADPGRNRAGEINDNDGGRGMYWEDPDGHLLEIITVPYGGWPAGSAAS
jgi:catechol 2,3-dioxygenase-like lactoylglutathione lyase family enzyme